MNLKNSKIRDKIISYMYEEAEKMDKKLKEKIIEFLEHYLLLYYFNPSATFSYHLFNYFDQITMYNNHQSSTNSIESINKKLKKKAGTGWITFNAAMEHLHDFKMDYRSDYIRQVVGNELNKRRKSTVEKEQLIAMSLGRYNLTSEEQQLEDVIKLCHYIGELNEKNVIGQFESQFQSDIADLDDTDELVFDENELM